MPCNQNRKEYKIEQDYNKINKDLKNGRHQKISKKEQCFVNLSHDASMMHAFLCM